MVTGFLLVDANVLIDYVETEIAVLSIASRALAPVYVVREVLREVKRLDSAACERLGIHVLEPELEELAAAAARRGALSFEDHLCLLVAQARGWTCVTNDGALRRACAAENVAMLWGLELMAQRVAKRVAFGKRLADQGGIREDVALSFSEIEMARLLTLKAADHMDRWGYKAAQDLIAASKIVVPSMAQRVLDRAMQAHGGMGVSDDTPIAELFALNRCIRIADGPDRVHMSHLGKRTIEALAKSTLADSRGKPIPATVVTTHDGYSSTMQYVFSPDRALAPGKYQVTVDGRDTSKLELEVVAASSSATPPSWTDTAKVVHQEQIEYGCGPGKTVEVLAGTDSTLAFVELTDAGKQRMAGYVKVDKGTLRIGHGMCSGAFPLVRGGSYIAQITLLAPERGTSSSSKTVAFKYAP